MRTNEEKLDLFADLLEPVSEIATDKEWARLWTEGERFGAVRHAIKAHKRAVVEILAAIEGESPDTYTIDGLRMLMKLTALINRPDVKEFMDGLFPSQGQKEGSGNSGSATGNTGAAAT